MKKEFAWAIAIGIIFGLIVAFGIWKVNQSIKNTPNTIPSPSIKPTGVPNPTTKLNISNPQNEDVSTTQSITVNGTTKPNLFITISSQEDDYLTKSDSEGKFEQEIDLIAGINSIKVTVIEGNSPPIDANIVVIYSSALNEGTATESASLKPKAYIGIVTDATDQTLQIKTDKNEIKQISADTEKTEAVNIKEKPNKSVKLEDVAIGDYIAALGNVNNNGVLDAIRILITSPLEETELKVLSSKYNDNLDTDKNTLFYEYAEGELSSIRETAIDEEAAIIYTEIDDSIRTVFVLPTE